MKAAVPACLISFLCLCSSNPAEPALDYVNPRVYNVDFTFELQPDPDSIHRATDLKLWLPVPREWDSQREVRILSVDPPPHGEYTDPEFGNPMFFWDFGTMPEQPVYSVNLRYRLEALDLRADIDPSRVGAYDTTSDFYSHYTRSTEHIAVTPEIQALAREAVGEEQNPYWQAKRIHDFVVRKVRYKLFRPDKISGTRALLGTASVDEGTGEVYYQGACNMMTQLFVALCRAVGIPARGVTGMVGWGPWVNEEDLRVREERHTELSADGLATARLSGPFGGHRWPEFYLPGYGWIPVDPTWDRFPLIDNRRVILSKGTDVLIGPGAPPGDVEGYGEQRILLRNGRADAFGLGVWNLSRIRIADAKFLHASDPFPADAFATYGAWGDGGDPWSGEPAFDGRELLRDIDEVTRDHAEKQRVWAEAYEQKLWMEEPRQAFVLHMLRGIVGDETFLEIRDTYLALRHESGEAVPTRRFRDLAEEIHGEPLDWFFDQWLEREEVPELKLEGVQVERDGGRWLVRGNLRQLNKEAFRFPLELEVTTKAGKRSERVWVDSQNGSFQLSTPQEPNGIIVDPEFNLLKIQKMPPVLTTGYPDVLVVYGTQAEGEANKAAAQSFERGFLGLGDEVVKADTAVSEEDLNSPVLILFGRPETNLVARRFADAFRVSFDERAFTYEGVTYRKPSQGVSQVIEKPDGLPGLMVLHAGLSGEATRRVCDKSEWREALGGWFLVDAHASYVIYDTDEHRPLAFGDWEGFDSNLVWRADQPDPPVARREPVEISHYGDTLIDPYAWLEDPEDPAVIVYLEAENTYAEVMMAHTEALQEKLFEEMSGRVQEDAPAVPWQEGDYFYYSRWEEGKEGKGYPVYARKRGSMEAEEEVILDVNEIAEGHAYTRVPFPAISPGQDIMAFAVDTVGIPRYSTIRFRNLDTGELLPDAIHPASPLMAWANDNRTLFYVRAHPSAGVPSLFRHVVGTGPTADEVVLEEMTPMLNTTDGFLFVESGSGYLWLDLDQPEGEFRVLLEPEVGQEYDFDIVDDDLYVRTNEGGAENFRLLRTPLTAPGRENWEEVVPHRPDVLLEGFAVFRDYLVLQERVNGLVRIRIRAWSGGDEHELGLGEPAYEAHLQGGEFESNILRYDYSSLTTPASVYDYSLATGEEELVWRQEILGEFDPADYVSERLHARAPDGALVPISMVYLKGTGKDGENPLLLYGYGGATVEAAFDPDLFSLIDRGFAYAVAHVRGGREKGVSWEKDGQGLNTRNRFTDFIAVAQFLIRERYTRPGRLFAHGISSGGLLVGAVANMRPDLFEGIVAQVPWVDVGTGFMTAGTAGELGNPKEEAHYRYVFSYSPYQNVEAKDYPHMLVTTALRDTQVPYWQPAKWVAKLRALKTDDNVLLLRTNLGAGGHAGAFGRNERWRETAFLYAFILDLAGKDE